jgi:hypothetical protein
MSISEKIQEGYDVFLHDGDKAFGAVRRVGKDMIVIYVENAGDFQVPLSAVVDAHSEKVILHSGKIDAKLKDAIARAHSGEDPRI